MRTRTKHIGSDPSQPFDPGEATLQAMRRKLASAEERLRSRRLLLAAMLQIMNQAQVGEAEAFRILRRAAMSNRQTVEAVSAQVLAGEFPLPRLLAG